MVVFGEVITGNCSPVLRRSEVLETISAVTAYPVPAKTFFQELRKTEVLCYVAWPILTYNRKGLPEEWHTGKTFNLKPRLFGLIPLGDHFVTVTEINPEKGRITTSEHGGAIISWEHEMKVEKEADYICYYTDRVSIEAGAATGRVYLFARVLYRHRQRRWHKWLKTHQ